MHPALVVLLVAAALLGAGYLAYTYLLPSSRQDAPVAGGPTRMANAPGGAAVHPLAKYVEVTGFRIREDKQQRLTVQMVVINHGGADIAGLQMNVSLHAKGDPIVDFPVTVKQIDPYGVVQATAVVPTKLRAYELPDWQFLDARVTLTAP